MEPADFHAGYHTELYRFERDGTTFGIIGRAVGAPFGVLVGMWARVRE